MNAPQCALCGVDITAANNSREHIIQQAIGGRREVPNVLCRACNSTTGNQWDSAAAHQLHFLSLKLQIVRQDGDVPPEDFPAMDGRPVRLHPDGHLTRPPQRPVVTEQNGQVHIQITAPNRREAVKVLEGQKRHYPKLDVEAGLGAMVYQETYHQTAPAAQDMTSKRVKTKAGVDAEQKRKNHTKARVRAKVEWPFRILKRVFGFTKVRYRGLKKNHEWLCAGFALANLYLKRKRLAKINLRLALQGA